MAIGRPSPFIEFQQSTIKYNLQHRLFLARTRDSAVGESQGRSDIKGRVRAWVALVNAFSPAQLKTAVISEDAYGDILSENKRKAALLNPTGLSYKEMSEQQRKMFMTLLDVYVKNYELGFSTTLMNKIKKAGIEKLSFAWAGGLKPGRGHYYRIQGPMLLIEFDNTQNNANHIHTVVRDLTNVLQKIFFASIGEGPFEN